jgi:hypothetical protein
MFDSLGFTEGNSKNMCSCNGILFVVESYHDNLPALCEYVGTGGVVEQMFAGVSERVEFEEEEKCKERVRAKRCGVSFRMIKRACNEGLASRSDQLQVEGLLAMMLWISTSSSPLFLSGALEVWLCCVEKLLPNGGIGKGLQVYSETVALVRGVLERVEGMIDSGAEEEDPEERLRQGHIESVQETIRTIREELGPLALEVDFCSMKLEVLNDSECECVDERGAEVEKEEVCLTDRCKTMNPGGVASNSMGVPIALGMAASAVHLFWICSGSS